MKKRILKKRTKKLEERERILKNKESKRVIKNNNYGITLIALVITVIVLLILAGISISMLSGDNTILSRATQAKIKTGNSQDEEAISLAYLATITGNYTNGDDISSTLTSELEKNYGSGKVNVTKDGSTYKISIDGKGDYTIDVNGKVEKSGPLVSYANIRIVTNSDGTGENVAAGTKTPTTDKLYIYFEVSVEAGTTSISPAVPFEISENGTYNFTITSTVNGENYTTTHAVTANQYAVRAGIKIGDYITYTSPTASVTFNADETGYSTYATTQATLNRKSLFRVMDIDSEGNMELIGAMTSDDTQIYFSGAQGYNNAVSVLNNKCSDLYKDESKRITARSIKEEDITSRFNSTGKKKITDYIDERIGNIETPTSNTLKTGTYIKFIDKTNKTVTYQDSGTIYRTYYPNIFQYEVGGKIGDIATTVALARSAKALTSLYGADEILTSTDTEGESATAIPQSSKSATTLTVPYTYSSTSHTADDFDNSEGKASAWQNIFFETGTYYWLASRCINCGSSEADFSLRFVHTSSLNAAAYLYYSNTYADRYGGRVCPIVSIPSTVQVTPCTGDNSSTNTHTVVTN